MRSGRVRARGVLCLRSWRAPPSQRAGMFTNLEALQSPYFRVFTEAASLRHDGSFSQSPAPSPSRRVEGGAAGAAGSSRLLIMAWSFRGPARILELPRSPPRAASLEQKTLRSPRKLPGF